MARWVFAVLAVVLAVAAGFVLLAFQRELARARAAAHQGSMIADTEAGPVEYAESGQGYPVLSIHGAGGGFDQGLTLAHDLIGEGFHIIAPSRFGYLRTPIAKDGSPPAQADVHDALLAELNITRAVIVGVSAGARSAVELAIRHPARVAALVLIVPGTYSPTSPVSITAGRGNEFAFWAVNNGGDFAWWAAEKIRPSILIRFVGVRPELIATASAASRERVMGIVKSMEPLSARFPGINLDSQADLHALPLQSIKVPTLVVSARDDLFNTLPAARYLAGRIPGAKLIVYEEGGHLLVGHEQQVKTEVGKFIAATIANSSS